MDVSKYKQEILQQVEDTGCGFINLRNPDNRAEILATVPKAPFIRWALHDALNERLLPKWSPVSPSGLKMPNDDRNHSDWMIGGGIDLYSYGGAHDDPIQMAAWDLRYKLFKDKMKFESVVLCNGGSVHGRCRLIQEGEELNNYWIRPGNIIVIPHAGVDFTEAFLLVTKEGKGGVICEMGNKVAHLCKIARERNATIMQHDNAMSKFTNRSWVHMNPDKGKISLGFCV